MSPAAPASDSPFAHFSDEYLMKAVTAMRNGVRLRLLVSGPDAEAELKRRGVAIPSNEAVEEPLDEVAQLRQSLGLGYFPEQLDECNMPGDMASPPKQSDSVSMNVSLNASGAGGIKDLMGILKGIEQGHADPAHDPDAGKDVMIGADDFPFDEEFANAPDEIYADPAVMMQTGDDLHGQGAEAPKVNGGGNPMQETLMNQLSRLYSEVKEGKKDDFDPLKHVKNPTKGEKAAAKDVKRGSYADRAAMLKSAEADGRLKK
jgi:hypothetical protein